MKKGLLIIIILLALLSRLAYLEVRPLHHDEGVNYFFTNSILAGGGFRYDPINYHGPFYFFYLALSFLILGINEFSLRLPAVIAGIAIVLVPFMFRVKDMHKPYVCSLFLLFMPSLLYYSRYSIHESSFVLFSLVSVYLLTNIIEEKSLEKLPYFALCVALLFTIKETVLIFLFGIFLMVIFNIKDLRQISLGKREKTLVFWSVIVFVCVYATFFSSFFSNINGIIDSFKGFMPWIERGVSEKGHDKAAYYYLLLLVKYEIVLLILGIVALFSCQKPEVFEHYQNSTSGLNQSSKTSGILKFRRLRESVFARNIALWLVSAFIVYSAIGYKTPWLIINMSVPLALLAGIGISEIKTKKRKYLLLLFSLIYLAFFSVYLNFYASWQASNNYAYVHTDADILNMVKEMKMQIGIEKVILVTSKEYWPLPFYIRDYEKVFYTEGKFDEAYFDEYDVLIMNAEQVNSADNLTLSRRYRLRDGVELVFGVKS